MYYLTGKILVRGGGIFGEESFYSFIYFAIILTNILFIYHPPKTMGIMFLPIYGCCSRESVADFNETFRKQ